MSTIFYRLIATPEIVVADYKVENHKMMLYTQF